jgi:hypothetical protein
VELDVSFGWTEFEHEAIATCTTAKYGPVSAPMARAEDLLIFKAMAARPKDIDDAATLLLMHDDIDLERVRRRLGELAALADEPSLAAGLEQVIQRWTKAATAIHPERSRASPKGKMRAHAPSAKRKPAKARRRSGP